MKPLGFLDLARNLLEAEAAMRARAADEVADRLSGYSAAQAPRWRLCWEQSPGRDAFERAGIIFLE